MRHRGKIAGRSSRRRPVEPRSSIPSGRNLDDFLGEALAVCFRDDPELATTLATILDLRLEVRQAHLPGAETRSDSLMEALRMLVQAALEVEEINRRQVLRCIEMLADHMALASRRQALLH